MLDRRKFLEAFEIIVPDASDAQRQQALDRYTEACRQLGSQEVWTIGDVLRAGNFHSELRPATSDLTAAETEVLRALEAFLSAGPDTGERLIHALRRFVSPQFTSPVASGQDWNIDSSRQHPDSVPEGALLIIAPFLHDEIGAVFCADNQMLAALHECPEEVGFISAVRNAKHDKPRFWCPVTGSTHHILIGPVPSSNYMPRLHFERKKTNAGD